MEQGHCGACRRKLRLTDTDRCPYGETQTMSHIVESCPRTKLNGGLSRLHSADEDAVLWLTSYGSRHAYEKKKNFASVVKTGQWPYENANKSPRIPNTAMVMEVECDLESVSETGSPSKVNQFFQLVGTINNTKFQWNRLITFAVILLTDRMTERMTDKPLWSHNVHQLAACTDVSIQTVWRLVNERSIRKRQFLQHRRFYQRTRLLSPTY